MILASCLLLAQVAVTAPAPAPTAPTAPTAPPPAAPELRPIGLALQSTSAFGVTHGRFFNQLIGARLDYRVTSEFAFGGLLSYANLEGKERRAHNVLPELWLAYRVPLSGDDFGLPIHFAPGYLPKNGATLRIGAGLDFQLGERASLELVPLELMAWINRERPEASLNGTLALRWSL